MQPLLRISGSEHNTIKRKLEDIAIIDYSMVYPDYLISSKHGFTVGIARGSWEDILGNKMPTASHIAMELSSFNTDIKIFLSEDFIGMFHDGKIALSGGRRREYNYVAVIDTILTACIANNALWVPSANINATVKLLRFWNNDYFQREKHKSLMTRFSKAGLIPKTEEEKDAELILLDQIFSLDPSENDKVWWLSDIPGLNIGLARAKIMKGEGSLIGLFIKSREELEAMPGVGPIIAQKFLEFIYEP